MKTIKVFIASSEELKLERLEFTDMLQQLNRILKPRGLEIEPVKWEYLDASMGPVHKQEEYNRELKTCQMCLVLYWTKFGEYTESELNTAYTELCAGRNPQKLYVYFKDAAEITPELQAFKDSFATKYGHFYCRFENVDTMRLSFLLQFEAYQNQRSESLLKIRDSKVEIDGQSLVELKQVPFAGNNAEYLQLLRDIERAQARVLKYPDEGDFRQELHDLTERRETMERSLLETAQLITRLSTTVSSARLAEAIRLFEQGDNKGADAVLNLVEIDRDAAANAARIRAARELEAEALRGLETNIEEYRLKIKTLQNAMAEEWLTEVVAVYDKAVAAARGQIAPEKLAGLLRDYADFLLKNKQYHRIGSLYAESLTIWRRLMQENPDAFAPDVAGTLNNLAILHADTQCQAQAEEEYAEALAIYRRLTQKDPNAFEPVVATNLNNIALLHSNARCYSQAEAEYEEALAIYRRLKQQRPDAFEAATARILNNLANLHHATRRYAQAEAEYEEVVAIYRCLTRKYPDAFEADAATAMALNNLALLHGNARRYAQAEAGYEEGLAICRRWVRKNPDVFEPSMVMMLNNLALLHGNTQRYAQAEKEYEEALAICRQSAQKSSDGFSSDVAMTLFNQALLYQNTQRHSQAEKAYGEALSIYRRLAQKNPDSFERNVAATLNNLAYLHGNARCHSQAEGEYEEALAIYRRLARKNPDVFEADMAMTLVNRAYLHGITQCYAQAQEEYAEALAIYRRLGQTTDMYNPQIENIEKSIDTIIAAGLTKKISLFRSHYGMLVVLLLVVVGILLWILL